MGIILGYFGQEETIGSIIFSFFHLKFMYTHYYDLCCFFVKTAVTKLKSSPGSPGSKVSASAAVSLRSAPRTLTFASPSSPGVLFARVALLNKYEYRALVAK